MAFPKKSKGGGMPQTPGRSPYASASAAKLGLTGGPMQPRLPSPPPAGAPKVATSNGTPNPFATPAAAPSNPMNGKSLPDPMRSPAPKPFAPPRGPAMPGMTAKAPKKPANRPAVKKSGRGR